MDRAADDRSSVAAIPLKVQRRILPPLLAGWFLAHLDRFNVGFAALQMNARVGLSPAAFGLGAGIFSLGYSLLEIPSNIVLVRAGARRERTRALAGSLIERTGSLSIVTTLFGALMVGGGALALLIDEAGPVVRSAPAGASGAA